MPSSVSAILGLFQVGRSIACQTVRVPTDKFKCQLVRSSVEAVKSFSASTRSTTLVLLRWVVRSHPSASATLSRVLTRSTIIGLTTSCQGVEISPVKLDDIEPENQECDICRQSFLPADDGTSPETPVSIQCGHIFGKNCLSQWIAVSADIDNSHQELEGVFRTIALYSDNQILEPLTLRSISWGGRSFTCPKCRKLSPTRTLSGEQAAEIEARLRFWDAVYEKLGIVRSDKEEVCRQDLVRLVEETKAERNTVAQNKMLLYDFHARVSVMRFALRRGRWDLTPVQRHLRDALFNLGCYGLNDPPGEYCAEAYEDRQQLPLWCWEFEQIERGMNSAFVWINGPADDWEQQRLGPWRRKLFAEIDLTQSENPCSWYFSEQVLGLGIEGTFGIQ
ncbi:hypothetical protein MMC29_001805 [Sticta canariensis]|nr:hypothetical protein [Sticta canariensis]